jgi:lysozyme
MKIGLAPKKQPYRGAYHYYRPNENSLEQATLLLKRFLEKSGFPVLDIERLPENQSVTENRIKRWLIAVEAL